MDKTWKKMLVLVVILSALYACTKQAQYISTVTPSENPYLVQLDSFSGNFVIYREDSFSTINDSYALIGHHDDPIFGKTTASFYTRFTIPETEELSNATKFDSLELILKTGRQSYGDSTVAMLVSVSRLAEAISSETNNFYNTSHFSTDPQVLGKVNKVFRPAAEDSLNILMDENFGLELFSLIKANATQVSNSDHFAEYFKGLKVYTDSISTFQVVAFQKSMTLRLHYHEDVGNIIPKYIDIRTATSPYQFNQIQRNFTGSALAALQTAKEVNATALQNRFFVQDLFRIRTRINFPGIKELQKVSDYVKILNAQLQIKPARASWVGYPLPAAMNMYTLQPDQTFSAALTNADGSTQDGGLTIDQVYGEETSYVYDVTNYLINELTTTDYTTQHLVLMHAATDSSLSRFAGNSTNASELRSRLIITALVYNNQ